METRYSIRSNACAFTLTIAFLAIVSLAKGNFIISSAAAAVAPPEGIPETTLPDSKIPENAPLDFQVLDADRDGSLDQEEFEAGHRGNESDFKTADTNSDGSLSPEEFSKWLNAAHDTETSSDGELPHNVPNKDNCYPKSAEHPEGGKCFFP